MSCMQRSSCMLTCYKELWSLRLQSTEIDFSLACLQDLGYCSFVEGLCLKFMGKSVIAYFTEGPCVCFASDMVH